MKTNVWIWNHYATPFFRDRAGRHYWFAENLIRRGYGVTVFCASTTHHAESNVDTGPDKYKEDSVNGIPFVFVKAAPYRGDGFRRIWNMASFSANLFAVAREYAGKQGKPDVILASSVHPLTLVSGIRTARKFGVPCICEIRDLWPESLVAYGALRRNSLAARILYRGEKWIYAKADALIMTCEGYRDYVLEKGWGDKVDGEKIRYISNGIVLDTFDRHASENPVSDPDLDDIRFKNIVYAGAISKVNHLDLLLDAAKIIRDRGYSDMRFLIYGAGTETDGLIRRCGEEAIGNVLFKGYVPKENVPAILKKAHVNILHNSSTILDKYGQSQNKLFEYMAAGRCIVQTYTTGYSICGRTGCGISAPVQTPEAIAEAVIEACADEEKWRVMGENARKAALEFDYGRLTEKLVDVIEAV